MMGLNLGAALIVMLIVCMIIVHMLGCMALAGINANAVSLVNLVMVSGWMDGWKIKSAFVYVSVDIMLLCSVTCVVISLVTKCCVVSLSVTWCH